MFISPVMMKERENISKVAIKNSDNAPKLSSHSIEVYGDQLLLIGGYDQSGFKQDKIHALDLKNG